MAATAQLQAEQAEVEAVLQSGIFNRAPNLYKFLEYVCACHLRGEAAQIKEYNIAVEALGRPPDFDQKKDSIVRVEAHRLRKRLGEYYSGSGSDHPLHICIPSGQYAPQFVLREAVLPSAAEDDEFHPTREIAAYLPPSILPVFSTSEAPSSGSLTALAQVASRKNLTLWLGAALTLFAALAAYIGLHQGTSETHEVWTGNWSVPVENEFRMLAGFRGAPFTDRQSHVWAPDSYYRGGRAVAISQGRIIEGAPDPTLVRSFREGDYRYDIPLRSGTYELHLYFAETGYSGNPSEGADVRSFKVEINDQLRLDLFDALSEAGAANRLQVRVFPDITPAADGKLHLRFSRQTGLPFLNALEILPSLPGRIRPIRIVARKNPVVDGEGRVWAADEFSTGGHLVERKDDIVNTRQKNLFEGERFGNFSYRLPVAPGKYQITLRFAETYFGTLPGAPPLTPGARLFNVFANGVALLRDFDIGAEAGGPSRGIERTFFDLEPNAQGLIVLDFVPIHNYACVNSIEVQQTN